MTGEALVQAAWNAWRNGPDGRQAVETCGSNSVGWLYLAFFAGWDAKGAQMAGTDTADTGSDRNTNGVSGNAQFPSSSSENHHTNSSSAPLLDGG